MYRALLLLAFLAPATSAQAPRTISHQGYLEQDGAPVSATLPITFGLFAVASGGTALWTEAHPAVDVADGIYGVVLGSITSLDGVDFNRPLWLQVRVDGNTLSPRTALTGVPAAMTLPAGATVSGAVTTGSQAALGGVNTATSGTAYGLYGESAVTGPNGAGVYGVAPRNGVVGLATTTGTATGFGVAGNSTAPTGTHYGVWGSSASTTGRGTFGWATATTGVNYGVYGLTQSTGGRGVYGHADANSGITYGIYGESDSEDGYGVYGTAPEVGVFGIATDGAITSAKGVWGESPSPEGDGVLGFASATSGENAGVTGWSASSEGRGVRGLALSDAGINYGVYGASESPHGSAAGVYGTASRNGVVGVATGGGGSTAVGVTGTSTATSGLHYGVLGATASTGGRGVLGWATAATGAAHGVYGLTQSTTGRGVYGHAQAASGTSYGVYGESASSSGYGGYFVGHTGAHGQTSAPNGRAVRGVATGAFSVGVWGESTDSDGTGGVFIGRRGVRASSTSNDLEDLILGGTSSANDDGRLFTDRNYQSSDLWLHSNDAVVVHLDYNGDGEDADFEIRNGAGTVIFNVDDSGAVSVNGVVVHSSDFYRKEGIVPVNPADVLDRIAALPVAEWSYRGEAARHIGPMAQDFHAAFGLGDTDTGIATVDADGVSLAAIQALYERVREQDARLAAQAAQIEALLRRVEALERAGE